MLPVRCAAALSASLAAAPAAAAEPWSDDDPSEPPARHELDAYGVTGGAEYRANWVYSNPTALDGTEDGATSYAEHRLRLDATVDYEETVAVVLSIDGLDGAVWGHENLRAAVGYQGGD